MTYTDILTTLKTTLENKIEQIGNDDSSTKIPEELLSLYSFVCLTLNGGAGGSGDPVSWGEIIGELSANSVLSDELNKRPKSDVTGITGADAISNIVSLSQAEYDALSSKNSSTLYIII